jgi:hypothetical protein
MKNPKRLNDRQQIMFHAAASPHRRPFDHKSLGPGLTWPVGLIDARPGGVGVRRWHVSRSQAMCPVETKPARTRATWAINKLACYREVLVNHRQLDEQIGRIKMRGCDFFVFSESRLFGVTTRMTASSRQCGSTPGRTGCRNRRVVGVQLDRSLGRHPGADRAEESRFPVGETTGARRPGCPQGG